MGLDLRIFQRVSVVRSNRWHADNPVANWWDEPKEWTGADWSNAMVGEAGEAANVVKKLRRAGAGMPGVNDPTVNVLRGQLADELGDVIAYAALLANHYELDLSHAVARKFNAVSRREGFGDRVSG